ADRTRGGDGAGVAFGIGGRGVAVPGAAEVARIEGARGRARRSVRSTIAARTRGEHRHDHGGGRATGKACQAAHGARAGNGLPSSILMLGAPAGPPLPNTRPSASFSYLSSAPGSPVHSGATTTVSESSGLI